MKKLKEIGSIKDSLKKEFSEEIAIEITKGLNLIIGNNMAVEIKKIEAAYGPKFVFFLYGQKIYLHKNFLSYPLYPSKDLTCETVFLAVIVASQ